MFWEEISQTNWTIDWALVIARVIIMISPTLYIVSDVTNHRTD